MYNIINSLTINDLKCISSKNMSLAIGLAKILTSLYFYQISAWLLAFTTNPNFIFLYMAFFAGLLLANRLFFVKDHELCDGKNEPLCGKTTCTFSGERYLTIM